MNFRPGRRCRNASQVIGIGQRCRGATVNFRQQAPRMRTAGAGLHQFPDKHACAVVLSLLQQHTCHEVAPPFSWKHENLLSARTEARDLRQFPLSRGAVQVYRHATTPSAAPNSKPRAKKNSSDNMVSLQLLKNPSSAAGADNPPTACYQVDECTLASREKSIREKYHRFRIGRSAHWNHRNGGIFTA